MAQSSKMGNNLMGPSINVGASFLSGMTTSAFSLVGQCVAPGMKVLDMVQGKAQDVMNLVLNGGMGVVNKASNFVGNVVGQALGTVSGLIGAVSNIADMIQLAIQNIINFAIQTLQNKIMELLSPPTAEIAAYTMEGMTYWREILEPEYQAMALGRKMDEFTEEEGKKKDKLTLNKCLEKANDALNTANEKIDQVQTLVTEKMQMVSNFLLAGPAWVTKQIGRIEELAKDHTYQFIDKEAQKLNKFRLKVAKNIGYKAGKVAAIKTLDLEYKVKRKAIQKVEEQKQKATTKAKTKTQSGVMKVLGTVGA